MSQPASSCWSGLEKKLFWFTENKDFFKKFRLNNIRHHRPPPPPTETGGNLASQESRLQTEAAATNISTEEGNVEEDLLNIRVLLVKLKSVLSQVRAEDEMSGSEVSSEASSVASSVARENEMLKRELKLLKLMIRERDTKIKNLENLINFDFTDWSIN